jgi:glycosyltransferase involved in cell wall biosynthesis
MNLINGEVLIGICAHESERSIARTIESVLSQKYTNWKIHIIVSKSTDNTLNICRQFEEPRIRIDEKESTQTWAESSIEILEQAESEYFMWLDADDFITENWLEENIRNVQTRDINSSFGQVLLSNDGGHSFLDNISNRRKFKFASVTNPKIRVFGYILVPESYGAVNLLYSVWKTKLLKKLITWDKSDLSSDFDTEFLLNALNKTSIHILENTYIVRENRGFNNLPSVANINLLSNRGKLSELRQLLWQLLVTKPRASRYIRLTLATYPKHLLLILPALFLRLTFSAASPLLISAKLRTRSKPFFAHKSH